MKTLFSFTIFLSAFLVFLVQPIVGKILLPMAGGSPSVWLTCMFFFQTALLGGYLYSHFSIKLLGVKKQAILHLILTVAAFFYLPISFPQMDGSPDNPVLWLYFKLFAQIGLPFIVLSALAPLIQVWFSLTGHQQSDNPYFLYAASNIGSFFALISYPLMIEPYFLIRQQTILWTTGFALLTALLLVCRIMIKPQNSTEKPSGVENHQTVNRHTIEYWVACAFVPSSMLLGVTLFLTTDLAPIPLLWIIPLMIYLATFVQAFSSYNFPDRFLNRVTFVAILIFPVAYFFRNPSFLIVSIPLNLFIFYSIALFCHSRLAKTRPDAEHLTSFYAWMSFGGMLGGMFNSLIAPVLFTSHLELPLMIVITALLFAKCQNESSSNDIITESGQALSSIIVGVMLAGLMNSINGIALHNIFRKACLFMAKDIAISPYFEILTFLRNHNITIAFAILITAALSPIVLHKSRLKLNLFLLSLTTIILMMFFTFSDGPVVLFATRNFFGQKTVNEQASGKMRTLVHGSTTHGAQFTDRENRFRPLTYYHPNGPAGDIFSLPMAQQQNFKAGIIGLGIGCLAAYAKPGQEFTFFEIDQEVVDIAESDLFFTYMSDNASSCSTIVGDGRLKIKEFPENHFNLILVDAFSSDSIPVHLITREAVEIYFAKLAKNGLLAVHVSNRYLKIHHALIAVARELQLRIVHVVDSSFNKKAEENKMRDNCHYVVITRDISSVDPLLNITDKKWIEVTSFNPGIPAWTDSYSSILPILRLPWNK